MDSQVGRLPGYSQQATPYSSHLFKFSMDPPRLHLREIDNILISRHTLLHRLDCTLWDVGRETTSRLIPKRFYPFEYPPLVQSELDRLIKQ